LNKKFCLITPGRSGSTSLMKVLEGFDNVAVPNKNIRCFNNELFHPRHVEKYKRQYTELCQAKIKTHHELLEKFFLYNENYEYIGFKTMPVRHRSDPGFLLRDDIQFIALVREDIPSTVASFLAAKNSFSWYRSGGETHKKLTLNGLDYFLIWGNTLYIFYNLRLLKKINNPIQIKYEDICSPGYCNSALNHFFNQSISLENPQPPTSGRDYVENWGTFKRFVDFWVNIFGRIPFST